MPASLKLILFEKKLIKKNSSSYDAVSWDRSSHLSLSASRVWLTNLPWGWLRLPFNVLLPLLKSFLKVPSSSQVGLQSEYRSRSFLRLLSSPHRYLHLQSWTLLLALQCCFSMRQESLDKITVDLRADIDLPPVAQVDKSTRSIYENSDMTPTLSSHFIWELQDNRVVKNLKFFTLNLEVMSKF